MTGQIKGTGSIYSPQRILHDYELCIEKTSAWHQLCPPDCPYRPLFHAIARASFCLDYTSTYLGHVLEITAELIVYLCKRYAALTTEMGNTQFKFAVYICNALFQKKKKVKTSHWDSTDPSAGNRS